MRKTANSPALLLITFMAVGCNSTTTPASPSRDVPGAEATTTAGTKSGSKLSLKKKKDPGISATPAIIPKTRANL
jgi:hypothetical protein